MKKQFKNGYALLIGIDKLKKIKLDHYDLNGSANAKALQEILTDKKACDYEKKNVLTLTGKKATRENIIESLLDIGKKIRKGKGENKSVLIYFSGPEYWDTHSKGSPYYLIPYDIENDYNQLRNSAINTKLFEGLLEALPPENLCIITDNAPFIPRKKEGDRSGNTPPPPPDADIEPTKKTGSKPFPDPIGTKNDIQKGKSRSGSTPPPPPDADIEPTKKTGSKPFPDPIEIKDIIQKDKNRSGNTPPPPPDADIEPTKKTGSKPFPDPPVDKGQWTISANINGGISHKQKKGRLSIFTANLIEALEGKVKKSKKNATEVITVSEVTDYLLNKVPKEAAKQGLKQKPTSKTNKIDFPIGLLRGGKGPKKKKIKAERQTRVETELVTKVPEKKKS